MISPELTVLYSICFFVFGACMGSFSNVVICRFPKGESVVKPASHCRHCKKNIKPWDNIPIFSYFILGGKCRNCKSPINMEYPLVELICGILFVGAYLKAGFSWTLAEWLLFSWAGLTASVIDFHHRILPDVFTLSGIVIGLLGALINPDRTVMASLSGILLGGGFLWAVAYIYLLLKNEEGMGGGDIKLIAWIGAVFGWKAVVFSILVSSITGSVFGIFWASIKKSGLKTSLPFGPFLYLAAIIYASAGNTVMQWYLSYFFPFVD